LSPFPHTRTLQMSKAVTKLAWMISFRSQSNLLGYDLSSRPFALKNKPTPRPLPAINQVLEFDPFRPRVSCPPARTTYTGKTPQGRNNCRKDQPKPSSSLTTSHLPYQLLHNSLELSSIWTPPSINPTDTLFSTTKRCSLFATTIPPSFCISLGRPLVDLRRFCRDFFRVQHWLIQHLHKRLVLDASSFICYHYYGVPLTRACTWRAFGVRYT
jgi:hypothetical protein